MTKSDLVSEGEVVSARQAFVGKKVAIIGYGNQGRAHALNMRDSGVEVLVGSLPESTGFSRAAEDGFSPVDASDAAAEADLVIAALPDTLHAVLVPRLFDAMNPTAVIGFLHGFSVHFKLVTLPARRAAVLLAPKGPGTALRQRFLEGTGIPALLATMESDQSAAAEELGIGWADAIGCARAGIVRTTFAAEAETDLFGEQAVLCGGLMGLIRAAYETLVNAGYPPLVAYMECAHEVKQIADLVCDRGLDGMLGSISPTARFGAVDAAPRIVDDALRDRLHAMLESVRDGSFAKRLAAESKDGWPKTSALRRELHESGIESAGREVRALLPWLRATQGSPR
ncbi:MAG: ketol-acid reductoisomerase [Planctomycetes bacterium]|nr:ketol-acid reductoisomerase [Planctomycetota bacterium]